MGVEAGEEEAEVPGEDVMPVRRVVEGAGLGEREGFEGCEGEVVEEEEGGEAGVD